MPIAITSATRVKGGSIAEAVMFAVKDIMRDIANTISPTDRPGADIVLIDEPKSQGSERYEVKVCGGNLEIHAGDDFGFIYGLYAVSREVLGVKDFWFWNDQRFEPVSVKEVPDDFTLVSHPSAVAYKGFFINDEVLLEDWSVDNDPDKPWRLAFETVYRLGGNMVIPGSGQRGEPHLELARKMGFYINQHHACPLGARMFAAAYPGIQARWPEEEPRFEALWKEAIESQKGKRTVWTLGFRGQGDTPFWAADPRYDTDEARGELLSQIIQRQYDLVQESDPGAQCAIYLYGEAMDLYRKGVLTYPKDVAKIWADNGFGRMVSRRQENWNPRIPAMPEGQDANGIYFHASFYDLQAANHITQLCNDPRLVVGELERVIENGGDDVWIVNASNIKPHLYMLSMIASVWRDGTIDCERVAKDYLSDYYGAGNADAVFNLYEDYWKVAVQYGPNWDDHAGEQYFNHVPRMLITQYMKDGEAPAEDLRWMYDGGSLREQIRHFMDLCEPAAGRYRRLYDNVEMTAIAAELRGQGDAAELIRDSIGVAAGIYSHCVAACVLVCRSLLEAQEGHYRHAFYHAGLAREEFTAGDQAMRSREHGKWAGYWHNDCLTDVKQSAWVCAQLMGYLRCIGDGPHYFQWKRDFTYPQWEKDVFVIMNMENHETDDEIFKAMKAVWNR
jgi:hypothetical protein